MSQQNAPVISPTDLAAIIGKSQGKGFTPGGHTRPQANAAFTPANFAASARVIELAPTFDDTEPHHHRVAEGFAPAHDLSPTPHQPRNVDAEIAAARVEGKQAGLAEGLAQGLAKGRADALAEAAQAQDHALTAARDTFLRAAAALSSPEGVLPEAFAQDLDRAVRRLAAERAGMAIDAHPAAFLSRITLLADRVAQGIRSITIALHPQDHTTLMAHLSGTAAMDGAALVPDARLSRGDVVVTGPAIRVADLLNGEDAA